MLEITSESVFKALVLAEVLSSSVKAFGKRRGLWETDTTFKEAFRVLKVLFVPYEPSQCVFAGSICPHNLART